MNPPHRNSTFERCQGGTGSDAWPGWGRWKPGSYVRRCHECDERFRGDGQAQTCADCAYAMETTA